MNNIELAKECGADIGTWDWSGNGANVVSFSFSELNDFVDAIEARFRERCINVAYVSSSNAVIPCRPINELYIAGLKLFTLPPAKKE